MIQPALAKFTLDISGEDPTLLLDDIELDIVDIDEKMHVFAECEQHLITTACFDGFPNELTLRVHSANGFGTFLFYEIEFYREGAGQLVAEYICHQPNKYWEGTWGLATYLNAIKDQLPFFRTLTLGDIELEDDWKRLTLRTVLIEGSAAEAIHRSADTLKKLMRDAEIALGGILWKPEYFSNERAFCKEVLAPLLRRMGFLSVRYIQGAREYGKDFTFSELTPFGNLRHYGLQAKAGDVSGGVNSAIDELVGQADDAFKMPYYDVASTEPRYISTFIIAISGRFTSNAKEKIIYKIPCGIHGSLLFLDQESIRELVARYWRVG
ncbi:MAG: hypothetical protein KME43_03950 [Myxacorys chilensis ATA2-1-KO14]|nr:hypothetical protein [Myxacorys chilensis ATA2-1-KO14]